MDKGAVVITGASTGIGRATAITLADAGFHVFAGVRKAADGAALAALTAGRLTPLLVDVTDEEAVRAAAETVAEGVGRAGLAGLVNNAGVGLTYPMEIVPVEMLRQQYEVNLFGQVAVIQAFLPLLRAGQGRMVNIGSIGDRLTLPFGAPLTSSKWAFASITEALRLELRPWGIHVVLVEPASIATEAAGKVQAETERTLAGFDETATALYGPAFRAMTGRLMAREHGGSRPEVVGRTVLRALTAPRPRTRYLAGKDSGRLAFAARWLPDRAFDAVRVRMFGLPKPFGGLRMG